MHTKLDAKQLAEVNDFVKTITDNCLSKFSDKPLYASVDIYEGTLTYVKLRVSIFCVQRQYCPCVLNQLALMIFASVAVSVAGTFTQGGHVAVPLQDLSKSMFAAHPESIGRNPSHN